MDEANCIQFTVPEDWAKMRADKALALHFKDFSRAHIQKSFKEGLVKQGPVVIRQNQSVQGGDVLSIVLLKPPEATVSPVNIPLEILYEDADLLVVNKAVEMVVHPGSGTATNTLVHAALHHTGGKLSLLAGAHRPGIVHRLDKNTTGAIVLAKTDKAYLSLIKQFSERLVDKIYWTVIAGIPEFRIGDIKSPIARHAHKRTIMAVRPQGREAHTHWKVLKIHGAFTLIECTLYTGRTHQIRVHMSHSLFPIVGDTTYGYQYRFNHPFKPDHLLLHAKELAFNHPRDEKKRIKIEAPLPKKDSAWEKIVTGSGTSP